MASHSARAASLFLAVLLVAPIVADEKPAPVMDVPTTHDVLKMIPLKGKNGLTLQTLCVNADGEIVALVAPQRSFGAPQKEVVSEIHVVTAEGEKVRQWSLDFHANSINVGPDGTVFVAGDGKVARFDARGKLLNRIELPHIAAMLRDTEGITKRAEEQLKQQKENFAEMVKTYHDRKKKLEEKKPEDRTKLEQRQLEQYDEIIQSFDETKKYYDSMTVKSIVEQITSRLRIINSIAVSPKDVFIVCGESEGYGFAVWRMDHSFGESKQVLKNVIGCCGQMDVQCCGSDLLVAENTKHRFARYDRDGKELGAWGKRGKETDPGCFGGCCNPMNLSLCASGDVLTAESEGIIKRFSSKGDYLGIVASTKLTGGCKNTAIAASPSGEMIYLCDQPNSRIIVLGLKPAKKAE